MAWLRIDDAFDHHPKLLALTTDQRRYTWIRILIYTCRYRTPTIPNNIADSVPRATPQFLNECAQLGLIDITDNGTYQVHDWDDYNGSDSKLQVRERVRKHRNRNAQSNAQSNAEVTHDETPNVTEPTVTPTLRERDSRAAARARPVPNPSPTTKTLTHSTSTPDVDGRTETSNEEPEPHLPPIAQILKEMPA